MAVVCTTLYISQTAATYREWDISPLGSTWLRSASDGIGSVWRRRGRGRETRRPRWRATWSPSPCTSWLPGSARRLSTARMIETEDCWREKISVLLSLPGTDWRWWQSNFASQPSPAQPRRRNVKYSEVIRISAKTWNSAIGIGTEWFS